MFFSVPYRGTYYESIKPNLPPKMAKFPFPTGVTYYEYLIIQLPYIIKTQAFPSPTGVNYYKYSKMFHLWIDILLFPSPTGVNHYELVDIVYNGYAVVFPSPTGVNHYESCVAPYYMRNRDSVSVPNRG